MATYLEKLYFWFLLGPIITLEWLRRKKKLCWATTAPVNEESGNEEVVEDSRGHYIQLGIRGDNEGELRPLIRVTSNTRTDYDMTISNNMRILRIIVRIAKFFYFTVYNMMCTVCNFLFIIILNKHKVVTRYVFYISVCMICAYVESDIVAVFYFILNSQGSLNNLKLTALRTVALGLTLNLSFSSSMHIIRKLMRPQESVFAGLSEK
nr:uncharacterized protein LOC131770965 [Pocillopora verrucosa]